MADLTAAQELRVWGEAFTERYKIETTAAHTIYKGTPMVMDHSNAVSVAVGSLVPFVAAFVPQVTDVFLGIAAEDKAVAAAQVHDTDIECYVWPTILGFKSTVFTNGASNGMAVYKDDSNILVGVASIVGNIRIGDVWRVEDGYCWVKLAETFIQAGSV